MSEGNALGLFFLNFDFNFKKPKITLKYFNSFIVKIHFSHRHAQDHNCSKLEEAQTEEKRSSKTAEHVNTILGKVQ